uniref:Uncharacterized protein n=1 Tax=Caenorhabditis tropicalis TaxID=1561998 RepID=A0A1I7U5M2_9PELO
MTSRKRDHRETRVDMEFEVPPKKRREKEGCDGHVIRDDVTESEVVVLVLVKNWMDGWPPQDDDETSETKKNG